MYRLSVVKHSTPNDIQVLFLDKNTELDFSHLNFNFNKGDQQSESVAYAISLQHVTPRDKQWEFSYFNLIV